MTTQEEAHDAAALVLAVSNQAIAQMTPHEQAVAAWTPTSSFVSIEALEDHIREQRGMTPLARTA